MFRSRHVKTGSVTASLLTVTLLAAACGGEAQPQTTAPPRTAGSTGTASAAAPPADVAEIRVAVTGGKVRPRPSVHKIRLGQTVRLIVTVDKADEVHVHGYDREMEVAPNKPTTIEFRADQPGLFEVETHESDLQLLQLQVS